MIPVIGPVREVTGVVKPTPQYQRWPLVGGQLLVALSMTVTQQVGLSVTFTDSKGNPASVDGVPTWLCDNTDVLALIPAGDGRSCLAQAVGAVGTSTISMTADADMGSGVEPIIGTLEVQVTAGKATQVVITAGTPVEQP